MRFNFPVGSDKIFVTWEDERIGTYPKPDAYGNIWWLNIASSSQVGYSTGPEKHLILTAQVTSKPIEPENLETWHIFNVNSTGNIVFNILDETGTTLIANVDDGEDLSSIDPDLYSVLRLQAFFSRTVPSSSPELDYWKVMWVGSDDDPPETTVEDILGDSGLNGWYVGNVKITLEATDGQQGSGVNHTYFKIDDGDVIEYDDDVGIKLPQHATGDPNTLYGEWDVWYWSDDKAGNNETPQGPLNIKIDKAPPYCEIWDPADRANVPRSGSFWVQATATDVGSGIHYVLFDVGPPYEDPVLVYDDDPAGSDNYKWWCDRSFDQNQWRHIIARAVDYAGHEYEDNIYVYFRKSLSVSGQIVTNPYVILRGMQTGGTSIQGSTMGGNSNPMIR